MKLGPRLDEPPLPSRKLSANQFDRINCKDADIVLIERVEMWSVVRGGGFSKHPDDDPEEASEFRHRSLAARALYSAAFRTVNVPSWIHPDRTSGWPPRTAPFDNGGVGRYVRGTRR